MFMFGLIKTKIMAVSLLHLLVGPFPTLSLSLDLRSPPAYIILNDNSQTL